MAETTPQQRKPAVVFNRVLQELRQQHQQQGRQDAFCGPSHQQVIPHDLEPTAAFQLVIAVSFESHAAAQLVVANNLQTPAAIQQANTNSFVNNPAGSAGNCQRP